MTLDGKAAQLRERRAGDPALSVPAYEWWNEGLHGVARSGHATVFPQAIGLAASWNTRLLEQVGTSPRPRRAPNSTAVAPAATTNVYEGLTIWSPNINIFRDPRWGRGMETYGEDPYLTGQLAVGFIRGLQGDDPQHPARSPRPSIWRCTAVLSRAAMASTSMFPARPGSHLPARFPRCDGEGGAVR